MDRVTRIGVSLEPELLGDFDRLISGEGYTNRSEAIRDLIRKRMVDTSWERMKGDVTGVVVLIYDHHTGGVVDKLLSIQHDTPVTIFSTMHVHVDHHNCMEIIAVSGKARKVKDFADGMRAIRGIKLCELVVAGAVQSG
jgi:CopG family nickel-responsive transcriptional regulator